MLQSSQTDEVLPVQLIKLQLVGFSIAHLILTQEQEDTAARWLLPLEEEVRVFGKLAAKETNVEDVRRCSFFFFSRSRWCFREAAGLSGGHESEFTRGFSETFLPVHQSSAVVIGLNTLTVLISPLFIWTVHLLYSTGTLEDFCLGFL